VLSTLRASIGRRKAENEARELIEAGEGGDHDTPYFFRAPSLMGTVDEWTRMAARWRRREYTLDTVEEDEDGLLHDAGADSA